MANRCARGYTGPACARCEKNWALGRSTPTCTECSTSYTWTRTGLIIGSVLFFVAVLYFGAARPYHKTRETQIIGWFAAKKSESFIFRSNVMGSAGGHVSRLKEEVSSVAASLKDVFKILLTFCQVVASVVKVQINWPIQLSNLMDSLRSLASFSFEVGSVSCALVDITKFHQLQMATCLPLATFVMLAIPMLLGLVRKIPRPRQKELSSLYFNSVFFILFVLYPTVCTEIFLFFSCDKIFLAGEEFKEYILYEDGWHQFLTIDYRVDCLSDEYKLYKTFAYIAVLVWPIGVPCFFLGMLCAYRVPQMASERMRVALELRFMEHCVHEHHHELKGLGPLLLEARGRPCNRLLETLSLPQLHQVYIVSKDEADSAEQDNGTALGHEELVAALLRRANALADIEAIVLPVQYWSGDHSEEEAQAMASLGMLICAYECQYWWFELFELLRKLTTISILTVVFSESASWFLASAFLVSFVSLVFTVNLKPYVEGSLDKLQFMSLLVTNLTLFYGILTQMSGVEDDGFSSDGSAQGILLTALNTSILVLPMLEILWAYSKSRHNPAAIFKSCGKKKPDAQPATKLKVSAARSEVNKRRRRSTASQKYFEVSADEATDALSSVHVNGHPHASALSSEAEARANTLQSAEGQEALLTVPPPLPSGPADVYADMEFHINAGALPMQRQSEHSFATASVPPPTMVHSCATQPAPPQSTPVRPVRRAEARQAVPSAPPLVFLSNTPRLLNTAAIQIPEIDSVKHGSLLARSRSSQDFR